MLSRIDGDRRRQLTAAVLTIVAVVAILGVAFALTGGVFVSDTVTINATQGPEVDVTVDSAREMELGGPSGGSDTVEVTTTDGSATFHSNGQTQVEINSNDLTGTWTNTTSLSVSGTTLTIDPADKPAASIEGDATAFAFRDLTVDDATPDFTYQGSSGSATVTVNDAPANTQLGAVDQNGNLLATATSDSSGTATFSGMDATSDRDVQVITPDGGPSVTAVSPSGDQDQKPSELNATIEDPDIDTGDEVTVTFTLDGSQIDQQTISSNGTVTTSIPSSGQTGGSHDWSVTATDEYGESGSDSASYKVPDQLRVLNETDTSQLVGSPPEVTIRFFGEDQVYERSGNPINMTGLPVDQDFIVEVEASSDYHSRTVYIQSIYEQQTVYLLNQSYSTVETRFTLDDPTGQFDSETILFVQKGINQSGSVAFRTIHADRFGVEGVTATLAEAERYQIKIMNDDGDEQDIGPYRADASETVTVRPGNPTIPLPDTDTGWAATASLDNRTLEYRYSDPDDQTDQVVVYVHEKGNKSNQLANKTHMNLGNASGTYTLTGNQSELTWVVNFDVQSDGDSYVLSREVANMVDLVPSFGGTWRLFAGLAMLFISAGVFSLLNRGVGGVVTAITGGLLYWTGWLSGATAAAGVVIALFVAIIYHAYTSSGP